MFARITEKLKGWKTIIANALTGLPAALYGLYLQFQGVDVTPLIPAKYVALAVFGMSVLGVVLRLITTGPVGSKGEETPSPQIKAGD
jgi:hypothetical protein